MLLLELDWEFSKKFGDWRRWGFKVSKLKAKMR